jgi:hypothetical protein
MYCNSKSVKKEKIKKKGIYETWTWDIVPDVIPDVYKDAVQVEWM